MTRFRRFWYLSRREKLFFFEAYILLLFSNIGVKTVAFRHISSYLHHWNEHSRKAIVRPYDIKNDIRLIDVAISRAANVLPWNSLCLSRSIAKLIMLRRRGIPAVLFAGVKSPKDSSLCAHAWVHAGDCVNGENSDRIESTEFTVLVRIGLEPFPHS